MKKIRNLLVPVDFSPTATHAFRYAFRLAGLIGADLHLLHVIYPQPENIDEPALSSSRATQAKKQLAAGKLEQLIQSTDAGPGTAAAPRPQLSYEVAEGGALAVIREQVKSGRFDLVILGTRGEHATVEKLLGTVASDVVGNAGCPVIVVPEHGRAEKIERIVHAVDPRRIRQPQVLDLVRQIRNLHREINLLWLTKEVAREAPARVRQLQGALEAELAGIPVKLYGLNKRSLVDDINTFAARENIDLLIMYRSDTTLLHKLFHRSRSREMAKKTSVPLLVV